MLKLISCRTDWDIRQIERIQQRIRRRFRVQGRLLIQRRLDLRLSYKRRPSNVTDQQWQLIQLYFKLEGIPSPYHGLKLVYSAPIDSVELLKRRIQYNISAEKQRAKTRVKNTTKGIRDINR